jgi:hypothetical protein
MISLGNKNCSITELNVSDNPLGIKSNLGGDAMTSTWVI